MKSDNIERIVEYDENGDVKYSRELFIALYSAMLNTPEEFALIVSEEPDIVKIISAGISDLFKDMEKLEGNIMTSIGIMLSLCSNYGQKNLLGVDISSVNAKSLKSRKCDDIIQQLVDEICKR